MNRLSSEKSPYLLQHATNPVNWYPWGEEAFMEAKRTNRPIFLSIGYSTCHWCHVMAHESFENKEVAEILNKNFVSIKVDREERPDVDKVYLKFTQAISGECGWPLSLFLTTDLKPFIAGTYFPLHDRYNRPGFLTLLHFVAGRWHTESEEIVRSADKLLSAIKNSLKPKNGKLLPLKELVEIENMCYNHLVRSFDDQHKGFTIAPKFPTCVNLEFLLCFYSVYPNDDSGKNALRMVGETLMAINRGGIHDHVGKGFHRYSVDAEWHVPHFEKMLYDQAQMLFAAAVYYMITGKLKDVIADIVSYVHDNLTHKSGGLYSAEDADSLPDFDSDKKKEGAYYVWTEKEIDEILKNKPVNDFQELTYADVFKLHYNVKPDGNVSRYSDPHGELKLKNVLIITEAEDISAKKCAISIENFRDVIMQSKALLQKAQKQRPHPHLDSKIITSWNALMISGLVKAAVAMENNELLSRAVNVVEFIKRSMIDGRLLHVAYVKDDGDIAINDTPVYAYAEDYACFIQALLDLYEASFDEKLIKLAFDLQKEMDDRFWDTAHNSGYYQTAKDPHIIFRFINNEDGAEPSINSIASMNLIRLYGISYQKSFSDRAVKIFESAAKDLKNHPFLLPKMISAFLMHEKRMRQVIVVGSRDCETTQQMLSIISKHFDCRRVLVSLDPAKDLWLQSVNDHFKHLAMSTDGVMTYICEDFKCLLPIASVVDLKKRINMNNS
ncbi:unnamed protein product [Thelazia callipaeda]|uniref:Thioredox_DsbH domain-containing protein n=1 Tax=Thelazia callipaeda TaxID=103827 RepID=A0A158RBR2_THECL|nr:unnamed protein product [Thelazia callipaeda]